MEAFHHFRVCHKIPEISERGESNYILFRLGNVDLWSLPYSDSVIDGWLTSAVHLGTAGESKCEVLFNFINNSVRSNQTTMEENFPFQLSAISALKEKYFDAARIVKQAIKNSRLKLFGQDGGNFNDYGKIHSLQG